MIKKLMKSIREYKKDSLLSPAMVTLEVIMEVIIPMLMARLIDYGIQAQNLGYIWKMGILLAVTAMISLMFGVLSGKFAARASAGFAKNLRKDMYYNVQNFSFSNICCNNTSAQFVVLVEIQKRQGDGHQASLPTKYMEGCDSHNGCCG